MYQYRKQCHTSLQNTINYPLTQTRIHPNLIDIELIQLCRTGSISRWTVVYKWCQMLRYILKWQGFHQLTSWNYFKPISNLSKMLPMRKYSHILSIPYWYKLKYFALKYLTYVLKYFCSPNYRTHYWRHHNMSIERRHSLVLSSASWCSELDVEHRSVGELLWLWTGF